jgi:hypothetical protein
VAEVEETTIRGENKAQKKIIKLMKSWIVTRRGTSRGSL